MNAERPTPDEHRAELARIHQAAPQTLYDAIVDAFEAHPAEAIPDKHVGFPHDREVLLLEVADNGLVLLEATYDGDEFLHVRALIIRGGRVETGLAPTEEVDELEYQYPTGETFASTEEEGPGIAPFHAYAIQDNALTISQLIKAGQPAKMNAANARIITEYLAAPRPPMAGMERGSNFGYG